MTRLWIALAMVMTYLMMVWFVTMSHFTEVLFRGIGVALVNAALWWLAITLWQVRRIRCHVCERKMHASMLIDGTDSKGKRLWICPSCRMDQGPMRDERARKQEWNA